MMANRFEAESFPPPKKKNKCDLHSCNISPDHMNNGTCRETMEFSCKIRHRV